MIDHERADGPAMDQDQRSKQWDDAAGPVCQRAGVGDEARGLLTDVLSTRGYLDVLAGRGLYADAIKVLAHAMPKREGVWLACLCAAEAVGPEPSPSSASALEAARAWVIDPTDANRRAAFPEAEAAGMGTPAGCAAASAYFSGGSLAPPDLPAVPPPEHVTARLVAAALTLAAVIKEPEKASEKFAAFLRIGLEVAAGQRPWPQSAPERAASAPTEGGVAHAPARRPRL
jgi:hypothetical protein